MITKCEQGNLLETKPVESIKYSNMDAALSRDEKFRYRLVREWSPEKSFVNFIMFNPSKADAHEDDPTIRRCVGFAKQWGFSGLIVTNLFAFRSTKPDHLFGMRNIIGDYNDCHLIDCARNANLIVAAWGNWGWLNDRAKFILNLLNNFEIFCLDITKKGFPKHPLYVPKSNKPIIYKARESKPKNCGCF